MKVAISVPDHLFLAADTLAGELKKSRSELYSDAVAAYLSAHGASAIREQLDAVYAKVDSSPDPGFLALQLEMMDPDETW